MGCLSFYFGCASSFSGPTMIMIQNILILCLLVTLMSLSAWLHVDEPGDWDKVGSVYDWEDDVCDVSPYKYTKPFEFHMVSLKKILQVV